MALVAKMHASSVKQGSGVRLVPCAAEDRGAKPTAEFRSAYDPPPWIRDSDFYREEQGHSSDSIELVAASASGDPDDPNRDWAAYSPTGHLTMTIDNPDALGYVQAGKDYKVTITEIRDRDRRSIDGQLDTKGQCSAPYPMSGYALAEAMEAGRRFEVQFLTGADAGWEHAHRRTDAGLVDAAWWREHLGQIVVTVREVSWDDPSILVEDSVALDPPEEPEHLWVPDVDDENILHFTVVRDPDLDAVGGYPIDCQVVDGEKGNRACVNHLDLSGEAIAIRESIRERLLS